jgi:adenosine/AMP kinase
MEARISVVPVTWQDGANIIIGQSHFIKTVEDLAEIMASTVPGAKYGLAFCEASGPCLVRTEGNDPALIADAVRAAQAIAAGHTFFLVLANAFPINVLARSRRAPRSAASSAQREMRCRFSWRVLSRAGGSWA